MQVWQSQLTTVVLVARPTSAHLERKPPLRRRASDHGIRAPTAGGQCRVPCARPPDHTALAMEAMGRVSPWRLPPPPEQIARATGTCVPSTRSAWHPACPAVDHPPIQAPTPIVGARLTAPTGILIRWPPQAGADHGHGQRRCGPSTIAPPALALALVRRGHAGSPQHHRSAAHLASTLQAECQAWKSAASIPRQKHAATSTR